MKDNETLKTEVMAAENSALSLHFIIYENEKKNASWVLFFVLTNWLLAYFSSNLPVLYYIVLGPVMHAYIGT